MTLFKKNLFTIIVATLILGGSAFAGSLTPTNSPGVTFVTLSDIYEKIQDNNYATSSRDFDHILPPAGTFVTLQNIWDKLSEIIAGINPENIISSTTIMGIAGAYDVSQLSPDKVAEGVVYGNGLVGTRISCAAGYHSVNGICSNTYSYSMNTWDRNYHDGESLPGGVYYPFSLQYGYAYGHGHPLAFDDSGKIYAAYYRGYIYSTDEGQTWTMVDVSTNIAQGTRWPTSIAVSPDGQDVWISIRGYGIYVSHDAGLNFDLENQLTDLYLGGDLRVLISPYNSEHLIVFTSHETGYGQTGGQIYRSVDSGNTWQSLNAAISTAGSPGPSDGTPVAFDPDDINTFYFISMINSNNAGLYVTTNGGTSFSRISGSTQYASAIGVANDGNGKRLIISGACSTPMHTSVSPISWAYVGGGNSGCGYNSTISVHPLSLNEVYLWNKGGRSLDGGKTVQEVNWPISSQDSIFSITFPDPFRAHIFFVGSYYGKILKSIDGGASWSIVGAFPYSQ